MSMGVRYAWADDAQTMMHIFVERPWTWKEYHITMQDALSLIEDKGYACATIVNIAAMGPVPTEGNMLQILLHVERIAPKNLTTSVVVGASYTIHVFLNMVMQLRPRTKQILLFADTMDEAREKILVRIRGLRE